MTHYVRFERDGGIHYGVLRGESVSPLEGELFGDHSIAQVSYALNEVKLLYPCTPRKIMAVGLNYKSHLGDRPAPLRPEIFFKPVSSLQNPGDPIIIPAGAMDVHYEGELVLVIGRELKSASPEEAREGIFGVTCGNDVSERQWQLGPDKDLQWWRAKGADTFAPMGPVIAQGAHYGNLLLQTRLNGEVVQTQHTSDLLFDPPAVVSWVSTYMTLWPGDVIYTGTPGATKAMRPGDIVEVEIEGIGVLRNPVSGT